MARLRVTGSTAFFAPVMKKRASHRYIRAKTKFTHGDPAMPLTTDEKLLNLSRDVIEGFDKAAGGVHPGFRPAHAKGVLLTGAFTPSKEATSLTPDPHIHRASSPVTVR